MGDKAGKYYSVNVPLKDGIDDATYVRLFKTVMSRVMEVRETFRYITCEQTSSNHLLCAAVLCCVLCAYHTIYVIDKTI